MRFFTRQTGEAARFMIGQPVPIREGMTATAHKLPRLMLLFMLVQSVGGFERLSARLTDFVAHVGVGDHVSLESR